MCGLGRLISHRTGGLDEGGEGGEAVVDVGESGGQRGTSDADDVGVAKVGDHPAIGQCIDEATCVGVVTAM